MGGEGVGHGGEGRKGGDGGLEESQEPVERGQYVAWSGRPGTMTNPQQL